MIPILSAAGDGGNQEGAPAPSWSFPGTRDGGRKSPVGCLLLWEATADRLTAGTASAAVGSEGFVGNWMFLEAVPIG